jgi:hypothetical protein
MDPLLKAKIMFHNWDSRDPHELIERARILRDIRHVPLSKLFHALEEVSQETADRIFLLLQGNINDNAENG